MVVTKKSPLRLAREKLGWSQKQMAEWFGWSQTMVSYFETDTRRKPSSVQAQRLRTFETLVGADQRLAKNITQPCKWWVRGQQNNLRRSAFEVFAHLETCPACTAFVVKLTR